MMSLNCLTPFHTATINVLSGKASSTSKLRLVDDGTMGDVVANDGLFTGQFISNKVGNFRLNFNANDSIMVKVRK